MDIKHYIFWALTHTRLWSRVISCLHVRWLFLLLRVWKKPNNNNKPPVLTKQLNIGPYLELAFLNNWYRKHLSSLFTAIRKGNCWVITNLGAIKLISYNALENWQFFLFKGDTWDSIRPCILSSFSFQGFADCESQKYLNFIYFLLSQSTSANSLDWKKRRSNHFSAGLSSSQAAWFVKEIAWFLRMFGINTANDISKFPKISRNA